jgi:NADPH-dependent curcumin reductase CurA
VVSGAAGAVGSVAGQLAKLRGARVVGIAGGAEKCSLITDFFGMDGSIDYKDRSKSLEEHLDEACPEGVDCE